MDERESRPSPEALLARAEREAAVEHRGKLKIFFGAAPGVGKTYAMLESAQARKKAGVDVVVGVVETHGRAETAARLAGLEQLPGGFDLDRALERKPELILIDELAHTNRTGARHVKRWQDVDELLSAGIDVYSTLNVQHIESLNDVVAQVTGVVVRETVPDQVLEMASEMELIDLPVEELIERMRAGKIYVPEQAERALAHFFRPGNLNALRELALRRTAEHVDTNVVALRGDSPTTPTWPVAERLLLAVGPSPYAQNLVRATKRLATQLEAEWFVVHVGSGMKDVLEFAQGLGAETATLSGQSVAHSILEFARVRNVTRIVVGKSPRSKLVGALIEGSGEISVIALDGGGRLTGQSRLALVVPKWRELLGAGIAIAATTALCVALRDSLAQANVVMLHLIAVVIVATRYSRETAIVASILSVASFDFFCVPPYLTFAVSDVEYILTFGVMLAVSLTISTLTVRLRQQATDAIERENRTQSLFRLSRELSGVQRMYEAAEAFAGIAAEVFRTKVNVFLPDDENKIRFRRRLEGGFLPPAQEEGIAQWCFDHGKTAGKGAGTLPGATAQYRALQVRGRSFGVVAMEQPPDGPLLDALLSQTALAMERLQTQEQARQAAFAAEGERLRNSLLSAVSHDLRTPLTSIAGAASTLLEQADQLDARRQRQLLTSITEESKRLNRLVTNLLEITRLDDGRLQLRLEWTAVEEVISSVLEGFGQRKFQVRIEPELPLIEAEALLLEQALQNLVENAVKYTPEDTVVEVEAGMAGRQLRIAVLDRGPGLPAGDVEQVFEKFYRGATAGNTRGVGLGLAIVKAIARAHGGTVRAGRRAGGGAIFEMLLPVKVK